MRSMKDPCLNIAEEYFCCNVDVHVLSRTFIWVTEDIKLYFFWMSNNCDITCINEFLLLANGNNVNSSTDLMLYPY